MANTLLTNPADPNREVTDYYMRDGFRHTIIAKDPATGIVNFRTTAIEPTATQTQAKDLTVIGHAVVADATASAPHIATLLPAIARSRQDAISVSAETTIDGKVFTPGLWYLPEDNAAAIANDFVKLAGGTDGIIQPRLIEFNNPALTQDDLVYGDVATVDLTGTDAANPLTLRLPGGEVSDRRMEIVIQDIPPGSFGTGFLRLVAQPNGANSVQILGPAGVTTDSIGTVFEQDLKGSEISLVRAVGSDRWMMRSQLPGHTTDTWVGSGDPLLAPDPAFFTRWIVDDTNPGIVRFFDVNSQIWRDQ